MKFIHVSDLHLGKRVNEFSMIEDQKYILHKVLQIVDEEKVDGIFLAGDIYDKSVPTAEAVQLFDQFLNGLAERNLYIFIISGNHDSAERLAFGGELLKERNVYVSPVFTKVPAPIPLKDEFGDIYIYLLPFLKPVYVRHVLGNEEEIHSYDEAIQHIIGAMQIDSTKRNVIVAHQFVTGAARSESEEISVGGMDNVNASHFDVFDYVALGHIHGPQQMTRKETRYCGTLLKYSFSECNHKKSVTVVELKEKGNVEIKTIPVSPLRDMCELKGTYDTLVSKEFYKDFQRDNYVHITLTNEEDIPDAMNKLRVIYPNIMKMDYDNKRTRSRQNIEEVKNVKQKSPMELFEELYRLQNNQDMSQEQQEFAKNLIEKIWENQ